MSVSSIIICKNEEKNIEACLETLKWCDEIIVIDDNSEDKTTVIAKKMKAKIFYHALENDFAQQRNYGLSVAEGDWVLFVDADERVAPMLKLEIVQLVNNPKQKYDGFLIKRKDYIWGKELKYGETSNVKLLRLAKRNLGLWSGKIHETWKIKGNIGKLKHSLIHFPHPSISGFLKEINFYTDLRSKELNEKSKSSNFLSIIIYPVGKFFLNYFIKKGFLDGIPGLLFATLMSFHSFLVRGKLWLMYKYHD